MSYISSEAIKYQNLNENLLFGHRPPTSFTFIFKNVSSGWIRPGLTSMMTTNIVQSWAQWLYPFIFTVLKRLTQTGLRIYIIEHIWSSWRQIRENRETWALKSLESYRMNPSVPLTPPVMLYPGGMFSVTIWETGLACWTRSALIRLPLFTSQSVCCVWWEVECRAALRSERVNEAELLKMFRDFREWNNLISTTLIKIQLTQTELACMRNC